MKKIDILNFIANFRRAPNEMKTHSELANHLGKDNEAVIYELLAELKKMGVLQETEQKGEKPYQVSKKIAQGFERFS